VLFVQASLSLTPNNNKKTFISDQVKSEWIYTSSPPTCLHGTKADYSQP